MINNLEQIKTFLDFPSEDVFYYLQILKRKKEHPELGSNSYVVKTYFIKSVEQLDKDFPEIECLCNFHNARAYINLNKRSFKRTALHTLKKMTDVILNEDYKSARMAYSSVCGEYAADTDKKWVVDIDNKNNREINQMITFIETLQPEGKKYITMIETKNGFHVITSPFNLQQFKENKDYSDVEVHKNNPTIIYIP